MCPADLGFLFLRKSSLNQEVVRVYFSHLIEPRVFFTEAVKARCVVAVESFIGNPGFKMRRGPALPLTTAEYLAPAVAPVIVDLSPDASTLQGEP